MLAVVCVLLAAGRGEGQGPAPAGPQGGGQGSQPSAPSRPYRGLFGSTQDPESAHRLILLGSTYAGRDDNVLADQPGVGINPGQTQRPGTLYGANLGLEYGKVGRRVDFGATLDAGTRYYPQDSGLTSGSYGVGAALSARLSRRSTLSLSQSASYQPYYQLSLFPDVSDPVLGGGIPSNLDYVVSRDSGWLSDTGVSLSQQLGRRSSMSFEYSLSRSNFDSEESTDPEITGTRRNLNSQAGGVRYNRQLTRHANLRLGYIYRRGNYSGITAPDVPTVVEGHDIDAGIEYARALSLLRRTTFSFSTGSSIVQAGGRRFFRFIGDAALRHEISRSWFASLRYNRDIGFVSSFSEPVFSDNLGLSLEGFLGERVSVSLSGGLAAGDIGTDLGDDATPGRDTSFKTYTASASLQYALTSNLALFASYSYFNYDFPLDPLLPVTGSLGRNGVRGGLQFTLPLIR